MVLAPVLIAPPYSGPDGLCVQCGHAGAGVSCVKLAGIGYALKRVCGRCSFDWLERPAVIGAVRTGQYA